jgi:hypothetical protein
MRWWANLWGRWLCLVAAACPSRVVLAIEGVDVVAARVQVLAAGQAPWAARCPAAVAADPESGWVVAAVDAELDGMRQQAGHCCGPLPRAGGRRTRAGGRRSGPVLVDRHARGRCHVLDEPSGRAVVAWPAGLVGFLAQGLACTRLSCAGWAGPAGQEMADLAPDARDTAHGGLFLQARIGGVAFGRAGPHGQRQIGC